MSGRFGKIALGISGGSAVLGLLSTWFNNKDRDEEIANAVDKRVEQTINRILGQKDVIEGEYEDIEEEDY